MTAAAEPPAPTRPKRRLPRWRYLAIFALLGVGAVAALAAGKPLFPGLYFIGLSALCCLAALVVLRPVLPPIFGPILFYDLLGTARRGATSSSAASTSPPWR